MDDGISFMFAGVGLFSVIAVLFSLTAVIESPEYNYTTIESTESWGAIE